MERVEGEEVDVEWVELKRRAPASLPSCWFIAPAVSVAVLVGQREREREREKKVRERDRQETE